MKSSGQWLYGEVVLSRLVFSQLVWEEGRTDESERTPAPALSTTRYPGRATTQVRIGQHVEDV
eukprot:3308130-Rhodomonas_salina.1